MNEETLRHDLFLLVGYLLTSAHGLYDEPKGYGPFRLLDAAGRLLTTMQTQGLSDPFLRQLEQTITAERVGHSDDEQLRGVLDNLCTEYAVELKRRVSQQEEKS
jgi:hypothetical protein